MLTRLKRVGEDLLSGIPKPRRLRTRLMGMLGIIILGIMLAMGGTIYTIVYRAKCEGRNRVVMGNESLPRSTES
jgi:hypothetical protein